MLVFDYENVENLLKTSFEEPKHGECVFDNVYAWGDDPYTPGIFISGATMGTLQKYGIAGEKETLKKKVGNKIKKLAGKVVPKKLKKETSIVEDENVLPHPYMTKVGVKTFDGRKNQYVRCEKTKIVIDEAKGEAVEIMLPVLVDRPLDFEEMLRLAEANPMLLAKVAPKQELTKDQILLLKDAIIAMPYNLHTIQDKKASKVWTPLKVIDVEQDNKDMALYQKLSLGALNMLAEREKNRVDTYDKFKEDVESVNFEHESATSNSK